MAIFISLRCEMRGDGRSPYGGTRCWSDDNDDPFVLSGETKKSASECLGLLFDDAREAGWKKIKGDWVCPNCQKHMA